MPNPVPGSTYDRQYRRAMEWTLTQSSGPSHIGQDTLPGLLPGQAPDYDWPNPRGYSRARDYGFVQSGKNVLVIAPPVPVYDWPNPRAYSRARDYGFVQSSPTYQRDTVSGGAPGQALDYDWCTPRGYPRARDYGFVQSGSSVTAVAAAPVALFDLSIPRGAPRARDYGFIQPSPTYQRDTLPGAAPGQAPDYDLPKPRGYPRASDYGFVQSGRSIGVPLQLYDLSIPRAYSRARDYGFVEGSPVWQNDNVTGAEGASPVYDWPIPRGYPKARDYGFVQPGLAVGVPSLFYDQAQPRPYARLRDYAWVQSAPTWLQPLVVSVPVYDWPRPRAYARALDYGFTVSSPLWLLPLGPPGTGSAFTGLGYPPGTARVTTDLSYQQGVATSNDVVLASGAATSTTTPPVLPGQSIPQSGPVSGTAVSS